MTPRATFTLPIAVFLGFLSSCKDSTESLSSSGAAEAVQKPSGQEQPATSAIQPETIDPELPSKLPRREKGKMADGRPAPPPAPESKKVGQPTATWIPGKPGFVFNPYTNNPVDVRGLPPGTLCRDPADEEKNHLFRVPPPAPADEGGD